LRFQELINKGEDDTVKDLLDLTVIVFVIHKSRTKQQTLKLVDSSVPDKS
jgi:hypothetical protein